MKFPLPKIYPITDIGLSGMSHAEQTAGLIDGGASLIQLREKKASSGMFLEDAKCAVKLAHRRNAKVIINDRVDIALLAGADGVHLGQEDLPPHEARRLLGPSAIIGFSTHTLEQAELAMLMPELDYIAVGPIFGTSTKDDADPAVGLDLLKIVRKIVGSRPVVAIGGIKADTVRRVLHSGADSVATIAELYRTGPDIAANFRRLMEIVGIPGVKTP